MIRWAIAAYLWSVVLSLAAICCCCGPVEEDGFDNGFDEDSDFDTAPTDDATFLFPGQPEQLRRMLA